MSRVAIDPVIRAGERARAGEIRGQVFVADDVPHEIVAGDEDVDDQEQLSGEHDRRRRGQHPTHHSAARARGVRHDAGAQDAERKERDDDQPGHGREHGEQNELDGPKDEERPPTGAPAKRKRREQHANGQHDAQRVVENPAIHDVIAMQKMRDPVSTARAAEMRNGRSVRK